MKNMKNLSQTDYDKYLILELIPELIEEFGHIDAILLKKQKIHFANVCPSCGDYIPIGKDYDLCKNITNAGVDAIKQYLGMLTELDIVDQEDALECECFESETLDDEAELDEDEFLSYEELNDNLELALDEDYGDGNYEE